jgi:signal transduction histidine kinase
MVVGLDLARDSIPAGTQVPGLDVIEQASKQGVALTRQLLAFARQAPEALVRFDAAERVASIENMLRLVVGRMVQLEVVGTSQRLHVRADPTQFEQVIVNLAVNARDAMPAGGKLTIAVALAAPAVGPTRNPPPDKSLVRVTLQDTGSGISPAILDRLFEPFFTTKEPGRGTGLGLATAYGFARQAGGTLSVESTEGVGTIVRLELPLDRATVPNEAATEPSGSRESAVSPNP